MGGWCGGRSGRRGAGRSGQSGQALVEFALVVSLLLLLVVGTVEFGRFLSHLVVLRNAGYEAVRAAAVGTTDGVIRTRIQQHVAGVVPNAGVTSVWTEVDPFTGRTGYVVRYSDDGDGRWVEMHLSPIAGDRVRGDVVQVRLVWRFRPIFGGWVLPTVSTYTVRASGRVE